MQCIRPPSPNPIRKGGREGGHATAKSGGGSFPILCVRRVISRSVLKEVSGDPLQFLPRMHGASAAEGGEGNEYLEKFMAIRKDDLGLTPPRRASQDDVGSQEKVLPDALSRILDIGSPE